MTDDHDASSSRLSKILAELCQPGMRTPSSAGKAAVALAAHLQERAVDLQTAQERRQQAELDRLIQNPHDKATLIQMTDQAFRSSAAPRAADQLIHILDVQGIPRFFTRVERALLRGFQSFGGYLPGVAVPLVKEQMQRETANVILPAERELLSRFLAEKSAAGVRMNVNFLGEALLGQREAERRFQHYLEALAWPEIEVISVKISTLDSQITSLGRTAAVGRLADRLELLYRAAAKHPYRDANGRESEKLVYLDMEEYRDMSITADVFMNALDRPGLERMTGGIALQAYLPDSLATQETLLKWARNRVAKGGAAVTMRLVKGANMEMERVEASLQGWPQAPYKSKLETDANFKKMLTLALERENILAMRLGLASHNLFEVAYAIVLASERECLPRIQFEMLEGMANHQRRALHELVSNLLLYAPACGQDEFLHAIGYLVRRLDENSGPENYLRHTFRLEVGSPAWQTLENQFLASLEGASQVTNEPRRKQQRRLETGAADTMAAQGDWEGFSNEPDTDFTLAENLAWIEDLVSQARLVEQADSPLEWEVTGAASTDRPLREITDPSRPGHPRGQFYEASSEDVEEALRTADEDPDGWRQLPVAERSERLGQAARELRLSRGELLTLALAEGGKTVAEADPEVSEAVDFVEFYRRSAIALDGLDGVSAEGLGVVVVVSPWNFPIAIPTGGVAAALAAGNNVILKPASDTVLVAERVCRCFWDAGIPRSALQLLPGPGSSVGNRLTSDPRVKAVILTGGTETAQQILRGHPRVNLLAETGGKNATIVTAMADRDLAIKHVVHSAFNHAGQKCSATSLLILEKEVYEDERFRDALADAVESLKVGSAWELDSRIGPLIRPPSGPLESALKELEVGESWLVMPKQNRENPALVTPGIKWNVSPGSVTHMTEFFGPLLGVMCADSLADAIELANQTGYGLTSGLESLDSREQEYWRENIRAGNLYINRPTTGAIVLRQPFGGLGKSSFGPGIKAGGPHYVRQLMNMAVATTRPEDERLELKNSQLDLLYEEVLDGGTAKLSTEELDKLLAALSSFDSWAADEFLVSHDHFSLVGQDNQRFYRPVSQLRIRVTAQDTAGEILMRCFAALAVGSRATISLAPEYPAMPVAWLDQLTDRWGASVEFLEETDQMLVEAIHEGQVDRIRYADRDRVPDCIRETIADTGVYVADHSVLPHGLLELPWYVNEQSLSHDYHRYGNLGRRSDEVRSEPA